MTKRAKIRLNMTVLEIIQTMVEGNPGALSVLTQLVEKEDGVFDILSLDDMNIRGSQIWVGYNDYCLRDLAKFQQCVRDRDPEMVAIINREGGSEHVAVTNGASFERK